MQVKVRRSKESTKKRLLAGKNVKLLMEIQVSLSAEEKALVEKYHDPFISLADLENYFKSENTFKVVTVENKESYLSKYHIKARVDNGFEYLSNIQKLRDAVFTELKEKLDRLKSIDAWDGEETINL